MALDTMAAVAAPMILRRDRAHLQNILEAAQAAERYLLGKDEADFLQDRILQESVAHRLFTVGVSATRLSRAARHDAKGVAWRELADAGELLVRPGASLDWRLVWRMARRDLPRIAAEVRELVRKDQSAA